METVDLEATGCRGTKRLSADPLGDEPQPRVCRYGRLVACCASETDPAELGLDLSRMAVATRVVTARVPLGGRGDGSCLAADCPGYPAAVRRYHWIGHLATIREQVRAQRCCYLG